MSKYPRTEMFAISIPIAVVLAFLGTLWMRGCNSLCIQAEGYERATNELRAKGYVRVVDGWMLPAERPVAR